MTEHSYATCQGKSEIDNLKRRSDTQNGHLADIADSLGELREAEARRSGGESMLKWILGFAGFSGVAALVSAILQIAR